jgi:hypothetical protein
MRAPSHLPMALCFIPLRRPLGLVIRPDVINTSYTVYFTIYYFMCES